MDGEMTVVDMKILIWSCGTLLGVLGFLSVFLLNRLTRTLDRLQKDVGEIKTALQVHGTKHEELEKRVDKIETAIAA
jgi:cell division protein FtsB